MPSGPRARKTGIHVISRISIPSYSGLAESVKVGKFAVDVDAKAGEAAVKARLESPVAVNAAAQSVALDKFSGSLELAHPQMPMKQLKLPLAGSLRADLAQQTAALDLATQFDESKIAAKLRVAKFAPLALGFDLDIDQLNVDKYLPPKPAAEKAPKEDKLDFSALKGHDVTGNIRIGALQASRLKLSKLNAHLRLAGGRLDVAPLSLSLYEGTASGSLALDANGILSIDARDLGTGRSTQVKVTPTSGLDKDQISKIIDEGERHKVTDDLRRELAELRNQAETLLYTTEAALEGYKDLVDEETIEMARNAAGSLRSALDANADIVQIRDAYQSLEAMTFQIAEKLYGGGAPA